MRLLVSLRSSTSFLTILRSAERTATATWSSADIRLHFRKIVCRLLAERGELPSNGSDLLADGSDVTACLLAERSNLAANFAEQS